MATEFNLDDCFYTYQWDATDRVLVFTTMGFRKIGDEEDTLAVWEPIKTERIPCSDAEMATDLVLQLVREHKEEDGTQS
jgi:hypothetical protein